MNKFLLFCLLYFGILICGNSQSPDWLWAKRIGGINFDAAISLALDDSENVYTTGCFSGIVDFDPGPGIFNLSGNSFISKLDKFGNFMWAKAIAGTYSSCGYSIVVDTFASRAIYITGHFYGTTDFDPGPGVFNLTSLTNGDYDIFIIKLDGWGNFEWAKTLGSYGYDVPHDINIDVHGNVYLTGEFGSVAVVSKLDSMGNIAWTKMFNGGGAGFSIEVDYFGDGKVYTAGSFGGNCDFDPGAGTFILSGGGGFLSVLDSSGNFVSAKIIGGAAFSMSIDFAESKDIYITGVLYGTQDFDPGSGTYYMSSNGTNDIYVSKLDSSENFRWAKSFGGTDMDVGSKVYHGQSDPENIYFIGYYHGTIDFNSGPDTFNLSAAFQAGYGDGFICKFDTAGDFIWAKSIGGARDDFANSIALDASRNLYLTGYFNSSAVPFGSTILLNAGSSWSSTSDIFISKLDTSLLATGLDSASLSKDFTISPNPVSSTFSISINLFTQAGRFEIFNFLGKKLYSAACKGHITVNCELFPPGIYFVSLQTEKGITVQKLVKQ